MIKMLEKTAAKYLSVSSTAFPDKGSMPRKYTCDGVNVSPPMDIAFIPEGTVSLAIIVEDPDAPIHTWYHWLVWNVPVTAHIDEDAVHGIQGMNDFSKRFYCGPCPMSGIHQYVFKVYALDTMLTLHPNVKVSEMEKAIKGHVLAYGEMSAFYGRTFVSEKAAKN